MTSNARPHKISDSLIIALSLLSLLFSVGSSEVCFAFWSTSRWLSLPTWIVALLILSWLIALIIPLGLAVLLSGMSITPLRANPNLSIRRIFICYFSVVVTFAGIYYSMACKGDYDDTVTKINYYQWTAKTGIKDVRLNDYSRAFRGIGHRRWLGLEDTALRYKSNFLKPAQVEPVPVKDLERAAMEQSKPEVRGDAKAGFLLFGDCLYFSCVTISTVGYGDISPQHWYVRLAACTEAFLGIFIVGLGVGTYLSHHVSGTNNEVS